MLAQNNHDNLVEKFTVETRKEFERIRALDLTEEKQEELLRTYWNMRRWSPPNVFGETEEK